MRSPWRARTIQLTVVAAIVVVAVTLVAFSLRQPVVATYSPTPPSPRDAGRALVGPVLYTVDASDPKSDPVSLDTVWTTMTAAKEAGHARQAAEGHSSW